ncbi:MAG: hypothetical protein GF335_04670 [Candidatus Moranbacteria bacterium]|nr:hypothetical protein [Candidatus Moranbacteria bacterium]
MNRKTKQILIIITYILITISFLTFIYWIFFKPSCFDQKQNQGEEGVDCGGPCQRECLKFPEFKELEILETEIIPIEQGKYDVVAKMSNPNSKFGFNNIIYEIKLYKDKQEVCSSQGETYILPDQQHYIVNPNIACPKEPNEVIINIQNKEPHEFKGIEKPKLEILNKDYNFPTQSTVFFELNFQVANRSSYLFSKIDIMAVVKDRNGRIIASNRGDINHVKPGGVRDFRFFWPNQFEGNITSVEVEARSDVFNLDNIE